MRGQKEEKNKTNILTGIYLLSHRLLHISLFSFIFKNTHQL